MKNVNRIAATLVTKLAGRRAASHTVGVTGDVAARTLLEHWVRAPTTPQRLVVRSRIILCALDGTSAEEIAARVDVSPKTVRLWMTRFHEGGPEALLRDAPGRGRPPSIAPDAMQSRLREANLIGSDGLPISIRRAATFLGVSTSAVWRALKKRRTPDTPDSPRNRSP